MTLREIESIVEIIGKSYVSSVERKGRKEVVVYSKIFGMGGSLILDLFPFGLYSISIGKQGLVFEFSDETKNR